MEEPSFLVPVQRIVSGIDIKDDLLRQRLMRLQEERDQQALNGTRIMGDLVIARCRLATQLKTVEGRLPRHRCAVRSARFKLAGQYRHHRIATQLVVIVEVLVAQRNPEHPLTHQGRNAMFDQFRPAIISEARGQPINQSDRPIRHPQQQRSGVRGDRSSVKTTHNFAASDESKVKPFCATLCRHRGSSRIIKKSFSQNNFR
jgi:hypothetical protein